MLSVFLLMSAISTGALAATNGVPSSGECNQSAIQANANALAQAAQANIAAMVRQPANLSSASCFSNILNMGQNIGLSFFNPATLIQQLQQQVCNAAQSALQWPEQQLQSAMAQVNNATDGMVQVNTSNSGSSSSSISVNSNGNAFAIPQVNTSNALNSILG